MVVVLYEGLELVELVLVEEVGLLVFVLRVEARLLDVLLQTNKFLLLHALDQRRVLVVVVVVVEGLELRLSLV